MELTREEVRLREARQGVPWRFWGPYLSERQWGTVREDYSDNGDAWSYFTHDQSRSRTYRWGEDGLAGQCDEHQQMCFALALWNEQDPILKERLFGLTNVEGNHGEDVKEYYFFVDNLPTHCYQRWLYKYPQRAYPYADLVATNARRSRFEMEYELIDTGVFDDDRYFDVEVTYAKADPTDVVCRIVVTNRGPDAAPIHLLPTLWFRNTWTFPPHTPRPTLRRLDGAGTPLVRADHHELGTWHLHTPPGAELLFCDNETNATRLWGQADSPPFPKDGIGDHVLHGTPTVNPAGEGTKAAAHITLTVPAGGSIETYLRLVRGDPHPDPFADAARIVSEGLADADEFYAAITPPAVSGDEANVLRQALAGMLWSKQSYYFDVDLWLQEHRAHPLRHPLRHGTRNEAWFHMVNHDVISMPDTWEYPWYAAWDLAFHCLPLAMVDPDFATSQLDLMLSQVYLHPTGQIPAYEWNFGDVNPPVHAFATLFMHSVSGVLGDADRQFLRQSFTRLLINFTWWVNRKDPSGKNVFEGGFLGLDNIGVFDRSAPLPDGGRLEQADGTGWMALFSQNMLELAIALMKDDPAYDQFVVKFIEHFFWIAAAIDPIGDHPDEMWDEEDGFFYDVLRRPDGTGQRLKVRSLVGLLPFCAVTVLSADLIAQFPEVTDRIRTYLRRNQDLIANVADPFKPGHKGRRLLSLVNEHKMRRILARMLDEDRFLGPHGIRSISRVHLAQPYELVLDGVTHCVQYEPAESTTGMFGGNSNWRGPVWFPINALIIRALLQYYRYYGDEVTIECPTGSGTQMTLFEVAAELARRLTATFLRGDDGRRPVYGGTERFQTDPHWRDLILFYEYFHGDNGAGLGASHQTGWTGLVAPLIQMFGHLTPDAVLGPDVRTLARPFRRVTGESMAPITTVREARGVSPESPRASERSGTVSP